MNKQVLYLLLTLMSIPIWGQNPYKILVKAYKSDSIPLLEEFLNDWNRKSVPNTNLDGLLEVEKNAYEIYEDFFNPFSIDKYGKHEWGNEIYSKIEYVIIQNNLQTIVLKTDSIDPNLMAPPDSIIKGKVDILCFKPNLRFENAKVLYLTSDYSGYLNKFLKKKHYKIGYGGIMNPAKAKGSTSEKQDFLNNKLLVLHGHWGGYWHLETHPQIGVIIFNRNLTQAKIIFRIAYQGGESFYVIKDGKWALQSSEITWIE